MTMEKNITLAELQEILFWQSLNKQLLALKEKGKNLKKQHHRHLQSFCFENLLFSKITGASLFDETPLSLVSDFKNISIITANSPKWLKVLSKAMPETYALDMDVALADSFDVLSDYDRKYKLTRDEGDDEGDEDLYEFINQYADLRKERQISDFSFIISESHILKSVALKKIMSKLDVKACLKIKNNQTILEVGELAKDGKPSRIYEEVNQIYVDEYCHEVERLVRKGSNLGRRINTQRVLSFLTEKAAEKGAKKSIKDFVKNEMPLFKNETNLKEKYIKAIQNRINARHTPNIVICDARPFFFLKNPLPLV
jgi:hypothetical protein